MKTANTHKAITPKVGKPALCFMCSARRLMGLTFERSFMKIRRAVLNL